MPGCPHFSLLLPSHWWCSEVKVPACNTGDLGDGSLCCKDPEGNGNLHSFVILPWESQDREKPGGLQSMNAKSRTRLSQTYSGSLPSFLPPTYFLPPVFLLSFRSSFLFQALFYSLGFGLHLLLSAFSPVLGCPGLSLPSLLRHTFSLPLYWGFLCAPVQFIFYRVSLSPGLPSQFSLFICRIRLAPGLAKLGLWPQTVSAPASTCSLPPPAD